MKHCTQLASLVALAAGVLLADVGHAEEVDGGKKKVEVATVYVLPAGSEKDVVKLLSLSKKMSNGGSLSASLRPSEVLVTLGAKLRVTLVHTSVAPKGSLRVGTVAILTTPGPAPKKLVSELVGRMKVSGVELPWLKTVSKPSEAELKREDEAAKAAEVEASAQTEKEAARGAEIERALKEARRLHKLGDRKGALKLLAATDSTGDRGLTFARAFATLRAGDKRAALALVAGLKPQGPDDVLSLKLLRGELSNAKDALSGVPNAQLCDSALVAERALDTGKIEIARELAHIIRTQVSDCARAWEVELRAMMTSGDSKGLKGVVAEALAKQGSVPSILQIAGEYFRSQGEFVRAIELVMRAAEKDPREPGLIEGLARALSADPAILPELVAKVEKRQAEGNARVVKDFVLGVSRHLGQDYAGSQSLLKGLKGALPETTILDVYLGSNDYHLGHREEAARRLKAAKVRTEHDVQLYYYRAEVLRDIDRKQAIEDLRRFLPFIQASHQGTTQEATRVKKLLADLEACHKAKEATCKGDWSVPRGAGQEGPPPGAAGTPGPAAEDGPKGGDETPDRSKAPAQEPGPSEGGDGDVGSKGTEAAAEDEENPVLIIVLSLGLLVGALLFRRMKV